MEEVYEWSNDSFYFNASYFNESYLTQWGNQSVPFFDLFDYDYFDIGMRAKRILSEPDKVSNFSNKICILSTFSNCNVLYLHSLKALLVLQLQYLKSLSQKLQI